MSHTRNLCILSNTWVLPFRDILSRNKFNFKSCIFFVDFSFFTHNHYN